MSVSDMSYQDKIGSRRLLSSARQVDFSLPALNEIQLGSFRDFLQEDTSQERRKLGLQYLFTSTFPFESSDGKVRLEFCKYVIGEKPYTLEQAMERDRTYSVPIRAVIRLILKETGEIKEQEVFICDMPYMTGHGTFVVNGTERVVVSQIHRSPGVIFDYDARKGMYHSRIIPDKGPWFEFEIIREVIYVRIDRKSRVLVSVFMRALGVVEVEDYLSIFFEEEEIKVSDFVGKNKDKEDFLTHFEGRRLFRTIVAPDEEQEVIAKASDVLTREKLDIILEKEVKSFSLITLDSQEAYGVALNALDKDDVTMSQEVACKYVYFVMRANQPTSVTVAMKEILPCYREVLVDEERKPSEVFATIRLKDAEGNINPHYVFLDEKGKEINVSDEQKWTRVDNSSFFHPSRYSLNEVGRFKINRKYGIDLKELTLTVSDIIETIRYLIKVKNSEFPVDDIDHLGNRRIRCVGEQLVNHLKLCFVRMERLARDRITIQNHSTLTPQTLISIKPITAGINEFFGTSQLSQFMDQTNPLSSVTHKRRLSALGPGGLTRERAGFEVRDIHYTHYGRVCPIETPEGPNIGLIVSLASFARINPFGFIEAPYFKVENGKVTDKVEWLSAIEEERYVVTSANIELDKNNCFVDEIVPVRHRGNYPMRLAKEVDYMDVSPYQIISLSAALIPFLEHDDANRALMGCNMMRQAVPLLFSDAPIIGTGIERVVAQNSNFCQFARHGGKVVYVDNSSIQIERDGDGEIDSYQLIKAERTNQDTFYNQIPIVNVGDKLKKGDFLTDGPSLSNGELALGKNVLAAFMTWEGYNYEDAILMSEKLLKDDTFTSVHIEQFEIEVRETKLGKEQITRDIPNISEEDYKDLDNDGIIGVGTYVKPGGILVGKVTPKSHTEITPEYRLLYSIFGEKARDVKDNSLRVPHGTSGVVIKVYRFKRENRDDLRPGVIEKVRVHLAKKRKLREGDKFAGRHGNKGVVARIIPEEDMPFMADGTPVDLVLNPLGVPSRMNMGQVMETIMGYIGYVSKESYSCSVFGSLSYDEAMKKLTKEKKIDMKGGMTLYDGRTGEAFKKKVTVGVMYYLKLAHLADDKIHARSTGPYSLITQQPLGGKAQFGGQRVGEMEVWAIEAYGAANILQEFLTVKSDAIEGRVRVYEAIVKGDFVSTPGMPESFNVLVQELRGLGLNIEMFDKDDRLINIIPKKKKDSALLFK